MEEMFRAGCAGPSLTGPVEHITESIQVSVGSQLEKLINQLSASEQSLEALKHGELFKRHEHYQQKLSALETKHDKVTSKLSQHEKESEERAAAERKAQEELERKSNVFTSALSSVNEPEWLKETEKRPSILGGPQDARRPSYDPVKDYKALDKQRKAAAAEAEKVSRNQGKSAEATRKYFAATDEAMDHAEAIMDTVAPLVAHLTAVFRAHHELLEATVHRLTMLDSAAVTVSEASHPDDEKGKNRIAQAAAQAAARAKGRDDASDAAAAAAAVWAGGSTGSGGNLGSAGGAPSLEEGASNLAALEDLREQTVLELKRKVQREAKSCEGTVFRKGWVSKTPYFAVVRGSCLELYADRSKYEFGKAPDETLKIQVVESSGETRPAATHPTAPASGGAAESLHSLHLSKRRGSEPQKIDSTLAYVAEEESSPEWQAEPAAPQTISLASPGVYSDIGDVLVVPFAGQFSFGSSGAVALVGGGAPSSGLATFKITAVHEAPAYWSEEEIRLARLAMGQAATDGSGGGGAGDGSAASSSSSAALSRDTKPGSTGGVQKVQLSFEGRSDGRLRDWGTALNACCAWEHGVVSIVPLLHAIDDASLFAERSRSGTGGAGGAGGAGGGGGTLSRPPSFASQSSSAASPPSVSSAAAMLALEGSVDVDVDDDDDEEDARTPMGETTPQPPPSPTPQPPSSPTGVTADAAAPPAAKPKSSGLRNPFARGLFSRSTAKSPPGKSRDSSPQPAPPEPATKEPATKNDEGAQAAKAGEEQEGAPPQAVVEDSISSEGASSSSSAEQPAAVGAEAEVSTGGEVGGGGNEDGGEEATEEAQAATKLQCMVRTRSAKATVAGKWGAKTVKQEEEGDESREQEEIAPGGGQEEEESVEAEEAGGAVEKKEEEEEEETPSASTEQRNEGGEDEVQSEVEVEVEASSNAQGSKGDGPGKEDTVEAEADVAVDAAMGQTGDDGSAPLADGAGEPESADASAPVDVSGVGKKDDHTDGEKELEGRSPPAPSGDPEEQQQNLGTEEAELGDNDKHAEQEGSPAPSGDEQSEATGAAEAMLEEVPPNGDGEAAPAPGHDGASMERAEEGPTLGEAPADGGGDCEKPPQEETTSPDVAGD